MQKITTYKFKNISIKHDVKLSVMWYNNKSSVLILVFDKDMDAYQLKHFVAEESATKYLETLKQLK